MSPRNANFGHISVNEKHDHVFDLYRLKVYKFSRFSMFACENLLDTNMIYYAATLNSNIEELLYILIRKQFI